MLAMMPGLWGVVASLTHLVGACTAATVAGLLYHRRQHHHAMGPAGGTIIAGLVVSTLWCLAVVVTGGLSPASQCLLALRNLAWLMILYRLFASDGRLVNVGPVRSITLALAAVDLMQGLVAFVGARIGMATVIGKMMFHCNILLAMLVTVGSLLLVHNLYIGADSSARRLLRWPALALGLVWSFELNLYTVAWLSSSWPMPLAALHGAVDTVCAGIMALGAVEGQESRRLYPSRTVTFRSVSLLIMGAYFVAMVAVARWLADAGGDFARWLQFGFLIMATACTLLLLPSRRLRSWLRVMVVKHFFQHRYDYRAEWLRFTHTVGRPGEGAPPLEERAIRALADIIDSPAGLLLMPGDARDLVLAARWQWAVDVPARAFPAHGVSWLEQRAFVLELDSTDGTDDSARVPEGADIVPAWLIEEPRAWALVPLLHYERLIGVVILARPPQARRMDWEDFDLLRIAGQQLASYLAEHASQQALAEANRFDDFHRRIAFVMHDIKNLASQFSLLARNAERHAENPAFRADMLVTLRASADRLGNMVARLSRYGADGIGKIEPIDAGGLARGVATVLGQGHRIVQVIEHTPAQALADGHSLEQVLTHLVQNGLDASETHSPVLIDIEQEAPWVRIKVIDSGHGMSAEFIRKRLFRPFDSSRPGGFGIGAYEARELVRAMQGRLEVESREGLGTRFIIHLPIASLYPVHDVAPTIPQEQYHYA